MLSVNQLNLEDLLLSDHFGFIVRPQLGNVKLMLGLRCIGLVSELPGTIHYVVIVIKHARVVNDDQAGLVWVVPAIKDRVIEEHAFLLF